MAGRRSFFRHMARETVVWFEELGGHRHILLSEVAKYPPATLSVLMPRISPGVQILAEQGRVSARLPGQEQALPLFPTEGADLFVFNRFNGQTELGKIAAELGAEMGWPAERSFSFVRERFLKLLMLRVCVPANPPPTA